jgi:hypothetical protein
MVWKLLWQWAKRRHRGKNRAILKSCGWRKEAAYSW